MTDTTERPPFLVVFRTRHSPHKLVFLTFAIVWGALFLFGEAPRGSVMPGALVKVWAAGLLAHGLFGLAGVLMPKQRIEQGLLVELGGMLIGVGALFLIVAGLFIYAGWAAFVSGGFTAAWAIANGLRASQIIRDLHHLRTAAGEPE